MQKLYRYTANGEGIWKAGKRLLPEDLIEEANENRKWLVKPNLPKGPYRFFLTEKGKEKYEETLLNVHKKYLDNIVCEEVNYDKIDGVVYEDDFQIVVSKTGIITVLVRIFHKITKKLIGFLKPLIILIARSYWFVLRPKTFGAKVVVTCGEEVLLVKHTYGYKLTLPGGGIKKGEKPEEAARRELIEEVSIVSGGLKYLGTIVSTLEYKIDTIYVYHTEVDGKETKIDNIEIERVEWQKLGSIQGAGSVTLQLIDLFKRNSV